MTTYCDYNARAHIEVEPYGWCWAAAAFLENHPRYHERFRQLRYRAAAADFDGQVRELYAADWPELAEEWQVFARDLEYGYDLEREAIDFRPGRELPTGGATVEVAADRGWQSTGITLEAGKSYRLQAQGQYQVADEPRPWISEPAGVTVRYYRGQPLGALLGRGTPGAVSSRRRQCAVKAAARWCRCKPAADDDRHAVLAHQ